MKAKLILRRAEVDYNAVCAGYKYKIIEVEIPDEDNFIQPCGLGHNLPEVIGFEWIKEAGYIGRRFKVNIEEIKKIVCDECSEHWAKNETCNDCPATKAISQKLFDYISEVVKGTRQGIFDGLKLCGVTVENDGDGVLTGVRVPGCLYSTEKDKRKEFIELVFGETIPTEVKE
jgi:hypothetical protein